MKNVNTNEAKLDLAQKFLDYANCADASYATKKYLCYIVFLPLFILFSACSSNEQDLRELCKNRYSKAIIYNKYYWDIFYNVQQGNTEHDENGEYYYNKELDKKIYFDYSKTKYIIIGKNKIGNITEYIYNSYYDDILYAIRYEYVYNCKGIFLEGDEGKGFYFTFEKTSYCKDVR